MKIDWFTIFAQTLNFLILMWLMKRFLYQPILHAIDERDRLIASELADVEAKKAEAQRERDEFKHKTEELDQQRTTLLGKATEEAKTERQRLLDEARKDAAVMSSKRQEALKNEAQALHQAIRRRTQQEVFAITRKALKDLAGTSLEERLGEVLIRRLREIDGQAKASLAEAFKTASDPALVRSTFEMPAEQRTVIQHALNVTFSAEIRLRFETTPDLISGIELTTNGQKVAWNFADYLGSLEKGIDELLKEKGKPEEKVSPKSEKKTEPKAEPNPDTKTKPKPEEKIKSEPEAKAQPKPDTKSEPDVKAQPKHEAKW